MPRFEERRPTYDFFIWDNFKAAYYSEPPPIPKLADNECPQCEGIPCKCDD